MIVQNILNIITIFIGIYMLAISIRIILTWFSGMYFGKPYEFLCRITDPYLKIFSRIRLFQLGNIDFSPIFALISLGIIQTILQTITITNTLSVGIILAIILSHLWRAVSFIVIIILILIAIRFIALLLKTNTVSSLWFFIDSLLQPVLFRLNRLFLRNKTITYQMGLTMGGLFFLAVLIAGNVLIRWFSILLAQLPF